MVRDLSASDDSRLTAKGAVCVIGGGIAGLIAASRLSESGRRVIVLESGDRKPLGRFDAFNAIEHAGAAYQNVYRRAGARAWRNVEHLGRAHHAARAP